MQHDGSEVPVYPPIGGSGQCGSHASERGTSNPQNRLLLETLLALHHNGPQGAGSSDALHARGSMHSPPLLQNSQGPPIPGSNWGPSSVGWGSSQHGIGLPGLPTMHAPVFSGGMGMGTAGTGDLAAPTAALPPGSAFSRVDRVRLPLHFRVIRRRDFSA